MAKIVKQFGDRDNVMIAVEAGKDDANREGVHVHVYKRGRRTDTRIPGNNRDLDDKDYDKAYELFNSNYSEIRDYYERVARGEFDT